MLGERGKAIGWGLATTAALAVLIVVGSGNGRRFDTTLLCYTFATLFATFGCTCRVVLWLHRPPTALYWRRGLQLFFTRGRVGSNALLVLGRFVADFLGNRFIWRRGLLRGAAHWLIMWGCLTALAITFPLVFGWVEFQSVPTDLGVYRVHVFGRAAGEFPVRSLVGFLVFHGLVWSSLLVVAGVLLAIRRRLRDQGAAALQQLSEDFLPLLLLLAISVTGLLLTISYTWMHGAAYEQLAILHAIAVIVTLLWLPFGKFFHVFMRPTHLAVGLYRQAGRDGEQAHCRRCGEAFASRLHVEDLIAVQQRLGFCYEMEGKAAHYQWICPRCRRALVCLAQAGPWRQRRAPSPAPAEPPPVPATPRPVEAWPGGAVPVPVSVP
jgi:hypothetical protein